MAIDEQSQLLDQLKKACLTGDEASLLSALKALLEWLTLPENNTDQNCRSVDLYVCMEIWPLLPGALAAEVEELLFDVGGQLHDTHTARPVAVNFNSTPEQLLARTRTLLGELQ